jgi:hypothetical protein
MRKILVLVALTVSVGFLTGMYADTASAFSFNGLPFFGNSAKSCVAPVCAPVGCGYYCAPVSACKSVKAKGKAKAETVTKEKKVKTEKKEKKEKK